MMKMVEDRISLDALFPELDREDFVRTSVLLSRENFERLGPYREQGRMSRLINILLDEHFKILQTREEWGE